ncbi:MAG: CocE/NonD family hydrolase [Thermoplasmatota archaeon]
MRLALVLLLVAAPLAGCLKPVDDYYAFDADQQYRNPGVFPGNYTFGVHSTVLKGGALPQGEPEVVQLRSTLPAYPGAAGDTTDGVVLITMAIWRPQNITEKLPIVIDAGPYFEETTCLAYARAYVGSVDLVQASQGRLRGECLAWSNMTIDQPQQRGPFLLANYLPRGYAVAQVAVRGTGTSGGCMDLMGPAEVHDLDQAVTWLAERPWSNGNVAMIGASYDGSTPWEVASTGNPHLKLIIPDSGLPDVYGLMFHNGSAETRAPIMHDEVYWPFGFTPQFPYDQAPVAVPPTPALPPEVPASLPGKPGVPGANAAGRAPYQERQNLLCPEVYRGALMGQASVLTGSRNAEAADYWALRDHRQAVLDNYKGAVFFVHGLQDWNVDPHSAIPFNAALRAKGVEMKEWYGQWDHAFPDTRCSARTPAWVVAPCRLDFAEVLGRMLDRTLKGNATVDTGPPIQVQDNLGYWRNADAFPPTDPEWLELRLTADHRLADAPSAEAMVELQSGTTALPGNYVELRSEPLERDLHLSGLPRLQLPFQTQGSGGELAAWLFDEGANGTVLAAWWDDHTRDGGGWVASTLRDPLLGRAQMNLLYHDGGETAQPVAPGQRYTARMEFEPLEAFVPKGHRLTLWLFQGHANDHQDSMTPAQVQVFLGGDAVLRLPRVDVDPTTVFPVPGVHLPDLASLDRRMVEKPAAPPTSTPPPV